MEMGGAYFFSFISIHTRSVVARDPSPDLYRGDRDASQTLILTVRISTGKGLESTCGITGASIGGHESLAKLAPRAHALRADAGEACATRHRHKRTLSSLAEHMWCSTVDVGRGNGECRKRRRAPVRASERLVEGRQAAAWPGRDRLRRRRAQAVASAASACLAARTRAAASLQKPSWEPMIR